MQSSCLKRISKDILYIKTYLQDYYVYDIEENNNIVTLTIITPNYNRLEFIISDGYPFKPPISILLNGENYKYHLSTMPSRIAYLYYHPYKFHTEDTRTLNITRPECLCCNISISPERWSPIISIHNILLEIINHNRLKEQIKYKLLLKEIFDFIDCTLDIIPVIYEFL